MTLSDLFLILNLIALESVLSIDNAAVLAVMVKPLPSDQSKKALKYGMLGAYGMRILCLFFVGSLVKFAFLKGIGGLYLLYLVYKHFTPAKDSPEEGMTTVDRGWYKNLYDYCVGKVGIFWSTVIMVEIMDLAFSIDNVFAAVAFTDKLWLIIIGVCIGITAMRFASGWFLTQMEKHPSLENSAFIVIGLLGLKLILACVADYVPAMASLKHILEDHYTDMIFSACMLIVMFIPLFISRKKVVTTP